MRRRLTKTADSPSLWNCSLAPGWTREEVQILRLALMKHGVGNWTEILDSSCLPGKNKSQLNLQTQRLLGQQSLGEFMGINLDSDSVYTVNAQKENVVRKNNVIINSGKNPTVAERNRRIEENRKKYGLPFERIDSIALPKRNLVEDVDAEARASQLKFLKARLAEYEAKLAELLEAEKQNQIQGVLTIDGMPDPAQQGMITPGQSIAGSLLRPDFSSLAKDGALNGQPAKRGRGRPRKTPLEVPGPGVDAAPLTIAPIVTVRPPQPQDAFVAPSAPAPKPIIIKKSAPKPRPTATGTSSEEWKSIVAALGEEEAEMLREHYYMMDELDDDFDDFEEPKPKKKRKAPGSTAKKAAAKKTKQPYEMGEPNDASTNQSEFDDL